MISSWAWSEDYSVGYYEIDEEHKLFLKTIQKIDEAFLGQDSPEYISRLLEELYKYAQFHFISEENIMLKYNYPSLEEHQTEHNSLMQKLGSILVTFDARLVNRKMLIDFLVEWFKYHTSISDKAFGQFLQSRIKNQNEPFRDYSTVTLLAKLRG